MGYNPHRKFTARTADYVALLAAMAVAAALVAWAVFS
jgi:hypothetical protein